MKNQLDDFTSKAQWDVDGFKIKKTHSGQKKAYGDTYYEYEITSENPQEDVERFCANRLYVAVPHDEWLRDYREKGCPMDKAFRPHYKFRKCGDGQYFYQVELIYAD